MLEAERERSNEFHKAWKLKLRHMVLLSMCAQMSCVGEWERSVGSHEVWKFRVCHMVLTGRRAWMLCVVASARIGPEATDYSLKCWAS